MTPLQTEDRLRISGTVLPVCTVESLTGPVSIIDLTSSTQQELGDVLYICNSYGGFTRHISSQSGGALVRGQERIGYRIVHGGASELAFQALSLDASKISAIRPFGNITDGERGSFGVQVTGSIRGLLAGAYEDIITIELTSD